MYCVNKMYSCIQSAGFESEKKINMDTTTNNRFGEVKRAILCILGDCNTHNIDDILAYVNKKISPKTIDKAYLYIAIYQLRAHHIPIMKFGNKLYRMEEDRCIVIENANFFVEKRLATCEEYIKQKLSTNLTDSEFFYLETLEKKIQNLIAEIRNTQQNTLHACKAGECSERR